MKNYVLSVKSRWEQREEDGEVIVDKRQFK